MESAEPVAADWPTNWHALDACMPQIVGKDSRSRAPRWNSSILAARLAERLGQNVALRTPVTMIRRITAAAISR